jgi:hypothetical protein
LAERSQIAASEIDEVSGKSVGIAQKSGEMLNLVVPNIQRTSDLVQEITASSVEQTQGADQINSAIQNLNNVVQENAATAEEMAAGAGNDVGDLSIDVDGDGEFECYKCDGRGTVETDVMGYDEFYDKVYTTNKLSDMDDDIPFEDRYYNSLVLKQPSLRERNFRETYSMEDIKYDWNVGNQIDELNDRNFVFFGGKLLL